jgi:hypothetical protein
MNFKITDVIVYMYKLAFKPYVSLHLKSIHVRLLTRESNHLHYAVQLSSP